MSGRQNSTYFFEVWGPCPHCCRVPQFVACYFSLAPKVIPIIPQFCAPTCCTLWRSVYSMLAQQGNLALIVHVNSRRFVISITKSMKHFQKLFIRVKFLPYFVECIFLCPYSRIKVKEALFRSTVTANFGSLRRRWISIWEILLKSSEIALIWKKIRRITTFVLSIFHKKQYLRW